ncbi:NYN domain-containing protein [Rhizobiaceae bacterium n13]|uniref:NYN domain-containing protein n=1 Tax=Ferirhizobium litorale TaxID=2927786 RepID=A0AAE3U3S4_9HYPH|nr:NYN domain-containing protein [Fererhizobium litorale]MDI7862035.1 NYN domain-containing protein [Fererhizobium litorale]MDI7922693.1 NYN domain-containing protein [Fererhizobium litorale]
MPTAVRRLAVLIDGENASARIADGLFKEIASIGDASVRRIYGDFANACSKSWAEAAAKHAIIPQQQFNNTVGKNASDIALVIDAMDLLHDGRFDGFCLVSSDSDFTRLAVRIREHGADVFGFGEKKTPESFRNACHRFVHLEDLLLVSASNCAPPTQPKPPKPVSAATPIIKKIITESKTNNGWVPLADVGKKLASLAFKSRTYGVSKLVDLVRKTNAFDVEQRNGKHVQIRIKQTATQKKS